MSKTDYDLVIIGAGPAGLTAGMYAARARMNVLLLEKAVPGGQILVTDWIENYPGFPEGISGFDLAEKMKTQAEAMGLKIETAEVHSLARPTTFRLSAAAMISAVALVAERMAKPSYWPMQAFNSSGVMPGL